MGLSFNRVFAVWEQARNWYLEVFQKALNCPDFFVTLMLVLSQLSIAGAVSVFVGGLGFCFVHHKRSYLSGFGFLRAAAMPLRCRRWKITLICAVCVRALHMSRFFFGGTD